MSAKTKEIEKMEENKNTAWIWVMIVYGAGVLFAASFNETLMLSFFSANNAVKYVAGLAVLVIASNALLFPYALHNWAVSGWHRIITSLFYATDVTFLALNTVVSFGKLSGTMPAWALDYLPYAPASMIIQGVASWAIIMISDPGEKSKIKLAKAWQDAQIDVYSNVVNWLSSDEGKGILKEAAGIMVGEIFNVERLSGKSSGVTSKRSGNHEDAPEEAVDHILRNMPKGFQGVVLEKGNHSHPPS